MKRIKKFYREHRIFTILMAVLLVCAVLIITVLIQCFYVGNGTDKYGDRLEGIENYEISSERQGDYESDLMENTKVKSASLSITGKIIYVKIVFETDVKLAEAKSIAQKSLDSFSDEEKSFYDFNFTLEQEATDNSEGFLIEGAHNKNGNGLLWNNNRAVESTES